MPSARFSNTDQNAVARVLVERHAAFERAAVVGHHARPEHRVRLARHQSVIHVRQDFGGVLPVAVQQHDDVEALCP